MPADACQAIQGCYGQRIFSSRDTTILFSIIQQRAKLLFEQHTYIVSYRLKNVSACKAKARQPLPNICYTLPDIQKISALQQNSQYQVCYNCYVTFHTSDQRNSLVQISHVHPIPRIQLNVHRYTFRCSQHGKVVHIKQAQHFDPSPNSCLYSRA